MSIDLTSCCACNEVVAVGLTFTQNFPGYDKAFIIHHSHLQEPLVIHSETPASGRCCVGGFTEINATINRGCFVPGETMRIDGEIVNHTNANIKYSKITIWQVRNCFGSLVES